MSGTGKDGRITKEDAQKAVEQKPVAAKVETTAVEVPSNISVTPFSRNTRSEKDEPYEENDRYKIGVCQKTVRPC